MQRKTVKQRKQELLNQIKQYRILLSPLSSQKSVEVKDGSIGLWDKSKIQSSLDYVERWLEVDWSNADHVRQSQVLLAEIEKAIDLLKDAS